MRIVDLTDSAGRVVEPGWLARAEPVHRQLRPQLPSDYAGKIARIASAGARVLVAVQGEDVRGVAVWRVLENTHLGVFLYVDDLITDSAHRSTGVGSAMLAACHAHARAHGAVQVVLDSGVQRADAHRFYFREGLSIVSFNFKGPVRGG